jgi:hypothetical protein
MDPFPPDSGDLIYSYHLLSSLSRAGVRVTVLAMHRRTGNAARSANDSGIEWVLVPLEGNRAIGGQLAVRSLFSGLPNVASQYNTASFRRALRVQLARDWDAIVVDHLGAGWVWPAVQAYRRRKVGVVSVFIAHQCEGEVRLNMARRFSGSMLRRIGVSYDAAKADRLERKLIRQSDIVTAITAEDFRCLGAGEKTVLLTPGYGGLRHSSSEINSTMPRRALILGNAVWLAKQMNLIEFMSAADELFCQHQIELWVVGNVPERLQATNRYRATRFLGFVEDLEPIFRNVRIGIVAERTGGGFKLKTLDYIFKRVPIAALEGAVAGLPLTPGLHYLSFASMRDLAHGIVAAIDDVDRLNSLQRAAYAKCSTGFDWSDRGRTLCNAIQQAVNRLSAVPAKRPAQ